MTIFSKLGNDIASPVDAGGNPRAPVPSEFQVWMTEVERSLAAFVAGGGIIFPDKATMDATLTYASNQMAWVLGDATAANNGVYRKSGASGSGSWVRLGDLPYSFIKATNAGAGTANALVATSPIPLPSADGGALIVLNIAATNTASPVTVAFNGASALTIKTAGGNNVIAGGLVAGMIVAGFKEGSNFRLMSDQASVAIQDMAQKWADEAEDIPVTTGPDRYSAKHWALKAAAAAATASGLIIASTLADLKALNIAGVNNGALIYMEGGFSPNDGQEGFFVYKSGSGATTDDAVYVQPDAGGGRFVRYEWERDNQLYGDWWGITYSSTAAQAANGNSLDDIFDFVQSSSSTGTVRFPVGVIYAELTEALTLTKKRGWKFVGGSAANASGSGGTRFYIRGGGADFFIKLRTVIQTAWEAMYFILDAAGMSGIIDVGAAPYYDTDGVTPIDTSAISSYLNSFDHITFTANAQAPSIALVHLHSAVTNIFRNCWVVGAARCWFLGAAGATVGDADVRCLAKGTCGQLTIENTLTDGDIYVRKLGGFRYISGQITRFDANNGRFVASSLESCESVVFDGTAIGYGGDFSSGFISSSMVIRSLKVTESCVIGGFNVFATAGGASTDWDVSPKWSSVNSQVTSATGILAIQASCTGKNINSRSRRDSRVGGGSEASVVDDQRTIRDYRPIIIEGRKTHDFTSIAAGLTQRTAITVTGAEMDGGPCAAWLSTGEAGLYFEANCTAANTIEVACTNRSASAIDPASGTLHAVQYKRTV